MNVGILGASGAVGETLISCLEKRQFPVSSLRLLASARSAGQHRHFRGQPIPIEDVTPGSFEGLDIAFFSAGASRSREFAPHAIRAGAIVVDNSSAFRMDPDVPLVVPEINAHSLTPGSKLVSVPNCSAIILLMALAPLRKLGVIERVIVSTYQSASGAGAAAMLELQDQTRDVLEGREPVPKVMPHPYAFNLFSHNTPVDAEGYNEEEVKVIQESRKILEQPDLKINVTCIRVPVLRAHSESVTVEFADSAPSLEAVHQCLQEAPGVRLVDDRTSNRFPMPLEASGQDDVLVGRLRHDVSNPRGLCMFVSGDQLLKGAALNAIQIAEAIIARRPVMA